MRTSRRYFLSALVRASGCVPLLAVAAGCGDSTPAPSSTPPSSGPAPAPVVEDLHKKKGQVADPQ